MKAFKFILIILLALILVDFSVSLVLDHMYENSFAGDSGKFNYYLKKAEDKEIIVLGNSRALCHIDPKELSVPVFNLARNNSQILYQLGLLHLIIDQKISCKKVVLHVDLPSDYISTDSKEKSNNFRKIQELKYYYGKSNYITNKIDQISTFERIKYLFQLSRFNGNIFGVINHYAPNEKLPPFDGFEPRIAGNADSSNTYLYMDKFLKWAEETPPNSSTELIVEFITLCKQNNIELLCFTSPVFFDTSSYNDKFSALKKEMKKQGVEYINYRDSIFTPLAPANLWGDAIHLNNKGAKIFSQKFNADIQHFLLKK